MKIGDLMREMDACTTQEQAKALVDSETARISALEGKNPSEVRQIVLSNIGYLSGYYDTKRMREIQQLFDAGHPIFGRSMPTPEEAFAAGLKAGGETRE